MTMIGLCGSAFGRSAPASRYCARALSQQRAHNGRATSALDNEPSAVTQAIERISRDNTVIIVAHRLSTVRNVVTFRRRNRRAGTFTQVQQQNEEFANLVRLGAASNSWANRG